MSRKPVTGGRDKLLNIKQAANLLNVSEASLRRWTDSGRMPCYRIGAQKARRFRREDLVAFVGGPLEPGDQETGGDGHDDAGSQSVEIRNIGLDVKYHHHVCSIYGRSAGRLKLSIPLLSEGLRVGDVCFVIASPSCRKLILNALRAVFPDIRTAIKDGQLVFPELKGDDEDMLDQLEDMFLKATYSGERKLRLVGDMEWALASGWGEQDIYRYELEYNNTLGHRFPIISLCQYNVEVFSGKAVLDALKSHEDTYQYPIRNVCF